jgi:hypothetical protein
MLFFATLSIAALEKAQWCRSRDRPVGTKQAAVSALLGGRTGGIDLCHIVFIREGEKENVCGLLRDMS